MNLIPRGLKDAAFAYLPGIVTEHYKKMWLHAFPSSRIYMNIPIYGQNFDIKIGKHTSSASIIKVYGGLNDYKLMVEKKKMILHVGSYTAIGADLMLINRQGHTPEFVSISMASELFFRKCGGEIYTKNYRERYGDIIIGNDVWIGNEVMVRGGVTIGDGAIIGAKALVTKDVQPYEIVGGVPARHLRYRFDKKIRDSLLRIAWWNWDENKIADNVELFYKPSKFCAKFDSEYRKR